MISIVMPLYNSERFLADAIDSVLNQSFSDWELIICDDGSTDNSYRLASKYSKKDARIVLLKNNFTKGASGARNTCIRHARGRYIAFLDSDDLWHHNKLEVQLKHMKKNQIGFSYGNYYNISESDKKINIVKSPQHISFHSMLLSNWVGCLTVMIDRNYFTDIEQPFIQRRNDYALWLTLLKQLKPQKFSGIDNILGFYRVNNYGLSSQKFSALQSYYTCIRTYGDRGILISLFMTQIYLCIMLIKKIFPRAYNQMVIPLVERFANK